MATITNNATVKSGNGLGPKTSILACTVATTTTAAAVAELALTHTIVGVADDSTTSHIAVQGTATLPTIAGVSEVCSFNQNP